MTAKLKL